MLRLISMVLAVFALATPSLAQVNFWKNEWPNTDFTKTSVDFKEIMSGGPPRDGIPAVDNPAMRKASAETRLGDREPVMTVEIAGQTPRAYPIRYLMWHEIANDVIGGVPVAVTFCPLCNSGIIFDRRVNGSVLTFGVSGKLRNSDMVMFDRESESWWQQFQGEAIVGALLGTKLKKIPGWMESWADFKARNPDGLVMDQPLANRPYGSNPYARYDSGRPFLYRGENPPHGVEPLARVVVVGNRAWPLTRLSELGEVTEAGLTISWKEGTASALDSRKIEKGRDVGSIRVRNSAGKDVPHDVAFAFAFHAFNPNGKWMLSQ
ncbi:MAG: DUF3179 domain-containing protein [Rhodobacteraceae bacterium]|nr:DUF3179 domain-containing protein [Paracoccaceae bacterium]